MVDRLLHRCTGDVCADLKGSRAREYLNILEIERERDRKMGKSNSKLTAEAMERLKQDTYCEYLRRSFPWQIL